MVFDYNMAIKVILVVLAVVILIALILQYQKKNPKKSGKMDRVKEDFTYQEEDFMNAKPYKTKKSKKEEHFDDGSMESTVDTGKSIFEQQKARLSDFPKINQPIKAADSDDKEEYPVLPTEDKDTEDYRAVDFEITRDSSDCYPRDRLTTEDLLPKDAANSKWAQNNPASQGSVGDQNFLNAGSHFGIDTVGQSLRNANLQLRSDPPIPKIEGISPWMNTTIDYDSNRRPFEIGSV